MASTEKTIKITNKQQFDRLVDIMEKNVNVARGLKFAGGFNVTREKYNDVWQEVTTALNSLGPPIRSTTAWQKVWTDFKLKTKIKLAHNKKELNATGGGVCKLQYLSPVEERVVNLLNIDKAIQQNGKVFGVPQSSSENIENIEHQIHDLLQQDEEQLQQDPPLEEINQSPLPSLSGRKRNKQESGEKRTNLLEEQTNYLKNIVEDIREMAENTKKKSPTQGGKIKT